MTLRPILWADLWDFLRAEQVSIEVAQAATQHPLLDEALEMHRMLMEKIAEVSWEHGILLGETLSTSCTQPASRVEAGQHAIISDPL
jgi:hypothetical protein